MSSTPSPHLPPQPDPLATREDCPSLELLAAYAEGRRLWSERYRLESHFAECDRCLALLVDVTAFRAEYPQKDDATEPNREGSPRNLTDGLFGLLRRPPRLLWAASGTVALAASLLVAILVREPAQSDLDTMIAAIGDQRVTEARLVGFEYGRRPDVFRSTDPNAMPPLTTQSHATVAEVQERAAAAAASMGTATPTVMHTLGMTQVITGDLDAAIQSLERSTTIDPPNAGFLSDLAAAYLTRGIRQNARQDVEHALAAANQAADLDRTLRPALFNRALALEKLDQRDRARAAWNDYLQVDASSPWADEARERMKP